MYIKLYFYSGVKYLTALSKLLLLSLHLIPLVIVLYIFKNDEYLNNLHANKYTKWSENNPVVGEKNIFFFETACHEHYYEKNLNPRQSCAIESAAKSNPNHTVYLLYTCFMNLENIPSELSYVKELLLYPNVKFLQLNIEDFVKSTVVEDWWGNGTIQQSYWPVVHKSDTLRILVLSMYGGTYFDLDYIVQRSIKDIGNFLAAESDTKLGNSVMSFQSDEIGQEIVNECLQELMDTFDGTKWSFNGPDLVTRVMSRKCDTNNVDEMTPRKCGGFNVLPAKAFYPIQFDRWQMAFSEREDLDQFFVGDLKESYGIHFWNSHSEHISIPAGSRQLYRRLAEQYCPKVVENTKSF